MLPPPLQGEYWGYVDVAATLGAAGVDVGKGCFANPGSCYASVGELPVCGCGLSHGNRGWRGAITRGCLAQPQTPHCSATSSVPCPLPVWLCAGLKDIEVFQVTEQNGNKSQEWAVVTR